MIFWVMIQLLCVNCCWFTPVWVRMYLKFHEKHTQGLQNPPEVIVAPFTLPVLPASFPLFCWNKFYLLVWSWSIDNDVWSSSTTKLGELGWTPWFWGGSWEDSHTICHTNGITTPLSPWVCCQNPSHSSNFPKLLNYHGHSLGSTINGNFIMLENSSKCFPLSVTPYLVLAELFHLLVLCPALGSSGQREMRSSWSGSSGG